MSIAYRPLSISLVQPGTDLMQPGHSLPEQATAESPALHAMTDLSRIAAATIGPDASLGRAEEHMRHSGVRLLFVVDVDHDLLGLITLTDLKGGRPVQFQREMGVPLAEIRVRDIMTPVGKLEAMSLREVEGARIGDVVETLKRTGRQHALVVERTPKGTAIRGIFSASRIGRQLGKPVETAGIAYTFAELEAALTH
jgi:CBS domain containing-hemolysin-like protein